MKIKILTLTESERCELTSGFRNGESHCFRMRCRCVLLKYEREVDQTTRLYLR